MIQFFLPVALATTSPSWEDTIDNVTPSIVSIRIASNRPFDTERASVSVATGFIVDAERGIILTNRHVVEPGPVTSQAVLLNNEEIDIWPVYRDPVHDFGFYRYNPEDIEFLQVRSLELCEQCPEVGLDVRLIGNDAGEKISILEATIARLDRNAPNYGRGRFNDFNTFYIQAAAGSSGGSSGSPVLNQEGKVVALNAGGKTRSASSFFLPLPRVNRALSLLQSQQPIPRGTLQSTFVFEPFDMARRLGLTTEEEGAFRAAHPDRDGVLILRNIAPGGPLDAVAKEGDILLHINNERINGFIELEQVLDAQVGQSVVIGIQRAGKKMEDTVVVSDLHSISPASFVQGCNGVLNTLSYQMARHYNVPIDGVYVASPGYCFQNAGVYRGAVMTAIDGKEVHTVEDMYAILQGLHDQQEVLVDYYRLSEPKRLLRGAMKWDRTWFALQYWKRNDATGLWDKEEALTVPQESPKEVQVTTFPKHSDKMANRLAAAMAIVRFDIPYSIGGVYGESFFGMGMIIDAESGLIAVDRDTVPIDLGDVQVTFAGDITIDGEVVWLHPEHNVALVKYDPKLIGETPVQSVELKDQIGEKGDKIYIYGMNYDYEVVGKKVEIKDLENLTTSLPRTPFFRDTNIEVWAVEGTPDMVGGVAVDKKGRVIGQWSSFPDLSSKDIERSLYVLPSFVIAEAVEHYRSGKDVQTLGVEFGTLNLVEARRFGFSPELLVDTEQVPRKFFFVVRTSATAPAHELLTFGDIVLRVNGQSVDTIRNLEEAYRKGEVTLSVLRSGTVQEVTVPTMALSGRGVADIMGWGGALFHDIPSYVSYQRAVPAQGVYITWCMYGAPCTRDRIRPTNRVISVNEQPVNSLEELKDIVRGLEVDKPVRLELSSLRGEPSTVAMRQDNHYWETFTLQYKEGQWQRAGLGD